MKRTALPKRITREELIWLAGWLEGEGCFCKDSTGRLSVSGTSTDYDTIVRVSRLLQCHITTSNPADEKHKRKWTAQLTGDRARVWMLRLLPLMMSRRQERIKECLLAEPTKVLLLVSEV